MRKRRRTRKVSAPVTRAATLVPDDAVDAFRAQHLDLTTRELMTAHGPARVLINDSESPLAWLASRKGRDGRALIGQDQFIAGERLRADFTRAHLCRASRRVGRGSVELAASTRGRAI